MKRTRKRNRGKVEKGNRWKRNTWKVRGNTRKKIWKVRVNEDEKKETREKRNRFQRKK